ncbi:hypothetical protein CXG81DRAFT_10794 [Caulochytrium protostelioides]|uniref:Ras-GEF domain-containing protein n=1 Tax=Caulochytrium protostelioides TaxID=1555241 RepID=A0A4P9XAQ2_9FUNG|nr:hypothetical protein CXG81DRAFT_10794 [Caulochytrium protostelioides]|eukprot:RKP02416.1 hypothetical protein CXG81DRAFT_10794 [Caulochytrium protostelioides]
MTLIEQQLFAAITPNELLCQSWAQRDAATRAPNITQLTSHFNALALWTVKSVVEPATVKQRAKRLSFLVDVAEQLREMGNYSTLMAIIAGLNKASVLRLKLTLKECGPKCLRKMSELETLMSADGAYRNYRTVVKSSILPCIPYIGVVLLDLTFMEDGNQDRIGDHINFVKRQMIAEVIRDLELKQTTAYPFKWNDEVARSFVLLPRASVEYESQLWAESKRKESSQPAQ